VHSKGEYPVLQSGFFAQLKCLGLGALLATLSGTARANDVVWHTSDFAPYFIVDGPSKGQGIADQRLQLVMEGLPQFQHHVLRGVTVARTNAELIREENVCLVARIKTKERESFSFFTAQPIIYTLSNGLITTRSRFALLAPYLNKNGAIFLKDFLSNSPGRLGLTPARSFGASLDEVLAQVRLARPQALVEVEADNHFRSRLLKLIHQDAFHAILGYPEELTYFTKQLGLNADDFVFIPVAEEPPLVAGHVACSKSELGRSVVSAVDALIAQPAFRQKVQAAYRRWLDNASLNHYNRLVQGK
jgi:uncharacterized protein (TIGR02285 family)